MADIALLEYEQSGALLQTYTNPKSSSELILKRIRKQKSLWERALDVFMPAGYPASVTGDYLAYQAYDSLQAFSSSIAGMLASRAVLEGVGVGDSKAHPTTALLLSVFQESFGRLATILFAHRLGSALEPECKMYRLAADFFNDAAMILDCLSPAFPKPARVLIFSAASVLRALCGVAAGSSKATLSAHFAKWDNLGDVNAKDSSQETVISLLGMLAGSVVVSWVSEPITTWITLLILLTIHLSMNYAAVRAVSMNTVNRQRANIVFSSLLTKNKAPSPKEVSARERIFESDGIIRGYDGERLGYARVGVDAVTIARQWMRSPQQGGIGAANQGLSLALELFREESYLMAMDRSRAYIQIYIGLKRECTSRQQLKAWLHALILAKVLTQESKGPLHHELRRQEKDEQGVTAMEMDKDLAQKISTTLEQTNRLYNDYCSRLEAVGWDLDTAALETTFGPRLDINSEDSKKSK